MNPSLGEKIAVCLLTYNHVHLIESTLASIQHQTLDGYEIIVSDDCSNDGTWERVQELSAGDPRILPVRTPQNMSMPGNANFAVSHTERPYIALLHHDDLCRPDLLEKWMDVMQRNPDVAYVFNAYGVYESEFVYRESISGERIEGREFLENFLLPRWDCAVRGTALIQRAAWEKVSGMRPEYGLLADIDLWMRLAMHWAVGYVNEPVLTVRQDRPADYPPEYAGQWSWSRYRYLYQIHADNRLVYFNIQSAENRVRWWKFRLRLNVETAKWLTYGVVRCKPEMLLSSDEGASPYDFMLLQVCRRLLKLIYQNVTR